MFPDSDIAKKFACSKTKMNYLICFGLAPYFREKLLQKIKKSECVAISFDESLNKEFQTEQMDIIVHYFYEDKVVSQYFDSQFMGHTAATELLQHLKCSLSKFSYSKLLQISVDFRGARTRYEQYLNDSKVEKKAIETSRKRKVVLEEIKTQKTKKVKLEKTVESLEKEADSLLEEAEEKENFLALSKARALRAKAKSVKSKDLPAVDQSLVDLEKELQSMID